MRGFTLSALLAIFVALLACKDPDPKCATVSGTIPTTMKLESCTDGRAREVSCSRSDPTEDWMCGCSLNGSLGRTFNKPAKNPPVDAGDRRELEEFLSRQCHWSLRLR